MLFLDMINQGKTVIDYCRDEKTYWVLLPDGTLQTFSKKQKAEKFVKDWYKDNIVPFEVGVGIIEWRIK